MKKAMIKGCIFVVTFLTALIISSLLLNKGNTDMTAEIGKPELPLVFMDVNGRNVNMMRGYLADMDERYMHADILPMDESRSLSFRIKQYGAEVSSVSFAVRSIDGTRLVEETAVSGIKRNGNEILADIVLKDLIEPEKEYNLVIQVMLEDGREAAYYTRVIQTEDYRMEEKLNFVDWFSRTALESDDLQELKTYMESSRDGDNTTLNKVTIHSSLTQLGWGDLEVERITDPVFNIQDMTRETASITVEYLVKYSRYDRDTYAAVKEGFRCRMGTDRMYLLNYERTADEFFAEEADSFIDDKVVLGILDPVLEMGESDGGKILAFEQSGALYSLNTMDYKLSRLFSSYDQECIDERALPGNSSFRILKVDETGNVYFLLMGYIPRGRYEGYCGVGVFYHNSSTNTIEELAFLPGEKAPDVIAAEMELLAGLNGQNELYILMDHMLFCINLESHLLEVLADNLNQNTCRVSESNKNIVWQNSDEEYNCRSLTLMNLNTGKETVIEADPGCVVYPLGFMEEDLIYGVARTADISVNHAGKMIFPMYQVRIQDENGKILMTYEKHGIYVTGCRLKENQIILERVERKGTGDYAYCADDQIVSGVAADESSNSITTLSTQEYQKLTAIQLKRSLEGKRMKFLTPKEVLYEGSREIKLPETEGTIETWFVYGSSGDVALFSEAGEAVNRAYDAGGVVLDQNGSYVWRKEKQHVRNQIMAIEGASATEERDALAVCLDTVLAYEGVTRSTQPLLDQGFTVAEILKENISNVQVLDLEDCCLESILYYPDREIPVLATLEDGNAVLIVGFNEQNVVIMNPENGQVYKVGMNDATEWLEENGNMFVTYVKGID